MVTGDLPIQLEVESLIPRNEIKDRRNNDENENDLCLNSIFGKNGENSSFRAIEATSQDEHPPPF